MKLYYCKIFPGGKLKYFILLFCLLSEAYSQTSYPGYIVEGVTWNSGTHNIAVQRNIISPSIPSEPVEINNNAQVDFKSGGAIDLKDGFEAGPFSDTNYFEAQLENPFDFVIIDNPYTTVIDDTVRVKKWEKFEIAFRLPDIYKDAVDNFFAHYPDVEEGDLNPYADDSLEVKIDLYSPTNRHFTRWAFFMREVKWDGQQADSCRAPGDAAGTEWLELDRENPLYDYHWHFRFSPDEANATVPWTFTVSISAPITEISYPRTFSGFQFICDAPEADNYGYVKVNPANNQYLKFDDDTPFFPLGHNYPDQTHTYATDAGTEWRECHYWANYYKRDFDVLLNSFEELKDVGANFASVMLRKTTFNPEWEILGFYDSTGYPNHSCPDGGANENARPENRQYNCWMFDSLLDNARENNIYLQLVTDPGQPVIDVPWYWGNNCYVENYVYPTHNDTATVNPFDISKYFISEDTVANEDWATEGSMYYWRRKYKYILSRWGYSTNIAMFELIRELDQTLGYRPPDTTLGSGWCDEFAGHSFNDFEKMKNTMRNFCDVILTDIKTKLDDDAEGGFNRPCLVSFTNSWDLMDSITRPAFTDYYDLLGDSLIDITDVHAYSGGININKRRADYINKIFSYYPDKPFHYGEADEFGRSVDVQKPDPDTPAFITVEDWVSKLYDNYDVSFHNQIWSTAFMGCFQPAQSWQYNVVHWWPDATPIPLIEPLNPNPSNVFNDTNVIEPIGGPIDGIKVVNRKNHHNYTMLENFFINSGIDLNDNLTPKYSYDENTGIEVYYFVTNDQKAAYGWVHNINKYWERSYYYRKFPTPPAQPVPGELYEEYYGCENNNLEPSATSFKLYDLDETNDSSEYYEVTFYPTRFDQPLPVDNSNPGFVNYLVVHFNNVYLGCDTPDADFAFKVVQQGSGHRMNPKLKVYSEKIHPGIKVFPNPTMGQFSVLLPFDNNSVYDLSVYNMAGQITLEKRQLKGNNINLNLSDIPKGIYFVKVICQGHSMFNKIIVQ